MPYSLGTLVIASRMDLGIAHGYAYWKLENLVIQLETTVLLKDEYLPARAISATPNILLDYYCVPFLFRTLKAPFFHPECS